MDDNSRTPPAPVGLVEAVEEVEAARHGNVGPLRTLAEFRKDAGQPYPEMSRAELAAALDAALSAQAGAAPGVVEEHQALFDMLGLFTPEGYLISGGSDYWRSARETVARASPLYSAG